MNKAAINQPLTGTIGGYAYAGIEKEHQISATRRALAEATAGMVYGDDYSYSVSREYGKNVYILRLISDRARDIKAESWVHKIGFFPFGGSYSLSLGPDGKPVTITIHEFND